MRCKVTPIGQPSHECTADMPFISTMIHRRYTVELLSGSPKEAIEFAALLAHQKRGVQTSAACLFAVGN